MDFALINAVPFVMALLFAVPIIKKLISHTARAWLSAAVMALLFAALAGYFPQVQALDLQYKAQQGVETEHQGEEPHNDEGEQTDSDAVILVQKETSAAADNPSNDSDLESTSEEAAVSVNAITRDIVWVPELGLTISFYLDGLSLLFALIVTGIGAGIFLYAGYYFEDTNEQARFISILFAFAGAMLGLVLSGNLLTLFIMWELTSITSFLLIGFKGAKSADARFGAQQAFVITGLGALALIAGFVLLAAISGTVLHGGGFVFDLAQIMQANPDAIAAHPFYIATLILVAIGAFTKSAQFPFHFWLPGAMSAPTPASAYLHSATMVKAGIYLLLRLYPPMHAHELWTGLLVFFGIGTMLIAAVIALFQRDLKGLLAYSTVSWLGALVGMIGLPDDEGIKAALIGIIAHALYKAALFLCAGTIDHNTGTRIIDKLGGLRKQMPVIAAVVIISGLSMAGLPIFFGFVAKEVLLDAWLESHFVGQQWSYIGIIVSAALTGTAGYILIWDVFFKEPSEEIHYHASPVPLTFAPVLLALGTTLLGFFLDGPIPFVEDLVATGVPKSINLHLLPDSAANPVFLTSMGIVAAGFVVFLLRGFWLPILSNMPIPRATEIYQGIIAGIDWLGDQVVKTQNGQVRYYLVVILGTVATVILTSGIIGDLARGQQIIRGAFTFDAAAGLRVILLILIILSSLFTVLFRKHMNAALSLGVLGYAVGGLFLLEPAPDVSLVQFLVETLGTILIVIMLGRISEKQRRDAMTKLWKGRSMIGDFNIGIVRDIAIAGAVGLAVFFFSLTALVNRPSRETIAEYHLEHTYELVGVEDVVGAIVADFRGMDTVIEVGVFATAALGVLTLLTRGLTQVGPLTPSRQLVKKQEEFDEDAIEGLRESTNINTPFTRMVSRLVLPLTFLVALSHIVNGSHAPGDGFTAGAVTGLVTALWFVVFGYDEAKQRWRLLAPQRLLRAGLFVVVINGLLPVIFGFESGTFLAHVDYGKLLGVKEILERFGLELTSALFFEIGIALTVFGGFGAIMEAIAHPSEALDFDTDDH